MRKQVGEAFADWTVGPDQPSIPAGTPVGGPPSGQVGQTIYLLDQPGLKQATVVLGEAGIQQTDPDVFALDVLGSALNGLGGAQQPSAPQRMPATGFEAYLPRL